MSVISVALCTYNGAEFLSEQLESYLRQTRQPDELIVGDDCSSDETVKIIRDFARRAPFPVELKINERNLGSTENFARAIARCRGDVVFLSDQDDVWLPDKIQRLAAELEAFPNAGLVFSDAEIVDEKLAPLDVKLSDLTFSPTVRRRAETGSFFEFLLLRNYITGATMAFRAQFRNLFLPIPPDIPEMIHDAWIAFVIIANADFRFVDEPLIKYRRHARQQLGVLLEGESENTNRCERYKKEIELARQIQTRVRKITREMNARPGDFARKDLIEAIAREEIKRLDERIVHHEMRKNISASRARRIAPVIRELYSGRYHEISKGFLSAAKDLFGKV